MEINVSLFNLKKKKQAHLLIILLINYRGIIGITATIGLSTFSY